MTQRSGVPQLDPAQGLLYFGGAGATQWAPPPPLSCGLVQRSRLSRYLGSPGPSPHFKCLAPPLALWSRVLSPYSKPGEQYAALTLLGGTKSGRPPPLPVIQCCLRRFRCVRGLASALLRHQSTLWTPVSPSCRARWLLVLPAPPGSSQWSPSRAPQLPASTHHQLTLGQVSSARRSLCRGVTPQPAVVVHVRLAPPPESPALPATQVRSPQAARLHVNPRLPGVGQAASSRGLRLSRDPPVSAQGGLRGSPPHTSGTPAMQLRDVPGLGSVFVEKLKAPLERQNQACAIFSRAATLPF
ncbi:hypothetical protein NDU88_006160 [Pleurodeles waltl]|uniref:Uncharacterized protein n=1 Tax=Pleurodeles waltl TaxID=8319 RepID=A0AAV7N1I8_PLEWA|nr:hypothetical protein NDU88_006160 [Pleurodeles waltl]